MRIRTNKPYKIFADWIEFNALEQFERALNQPFAVSGALMPDGHFGYGLPIGGVMATEGVVVPSWVGFDIGCGVSGLKTTFNLDDVVKNKNKLFGLLCNELIKEVKASPVIKPKVKCSSIALDSFNRLSPADWGSIGGGNHFAELCADENNNVWIIVHSGSRRVGAAIAGHYMAKAANSDQPQEGHFGVKVESELGKSYLLDQEFCLNYALSNREQILNTIISALQRNGVPGQGVWTDYINRHHNHCEFAHGLYIHRKGATHAEEGMLGIIPGDSERGSFVVVGKGNPDSLWSSSHGAGRCMSRGKANELGLNEKPEAYKNIQDVMRQQNDLVEVKHFLTPILTVKNAFCSAAYDVTAT